MSAINPTKRKAISLEVKIKILDSLATGRGATSVGKHFGLQESTIRTIKKNEEAIRKSVISGTKLSAHKSSYTRDIVKAKMEKALLIWMEDSSEKRIPVDGNTIKQMALKIYKQMKEIEPKTSSDQKDKKFEFSASRGWMTGFLQRNAIHNIKIKGDIDDPLAIQFSTKMAQIIEGDAFTSDQVWNAVPDLFWKRMPSRTYVAKPPVETSDTEEINEDEGEVPTFTSDVIKDGLELADKLSDHFRRHDPVDERVEKFQRNLKLLMGDYRKLYNDLNTAQLEHVNVTASELEQDFELEDITSD